MVVEIERRLISVEEFNQIIETGIFQEDERIELINGELIRMAPIGHEHSGQVNRLNRTLSRLLGHLVIVSVQNPIELPTWAEPQPDVMLLRPRGDDYSRSNPTASDVLSLIEVADTSLAYDRDVKGPVYAQAGIADYWLLNIVDSQLIVFRAPTLTGYASVQTLGRGDRVTPLAFPDLAIQVSDLLI